MRCSRSVEKPKRTRDGDGARHVALAGVRRAHPIAERRRLRDAAADAPERQAAEQRVGRWRRRSGTGTIRRAPSLRPGGAAGGGTRRGSDRRPARSAPRASEMRGSARAARAQATIVGADRRGADRGRRRAAAERRSRRSGRGGTAPCPPLTFPPDVARPPLRRVTLPTAPDRRDRRRARQASRRRPRERRRRSIALDARDHLLERRAARRRRSIWRASCCARAPGRFERGRAVETFICALARSTSASSSCSAASLRQSSAARHRVRRRRPAP